ncbi:MAG: HEAT repeat domain-containing protein [Chloroflexota bacterium]|nr:HEAT repeat domain-containing protein [Chloroflexota bacterium]
MADEITRFQFVQWLDRNDTDEAIYTITLMLPEPCARVHQAISKILTRDDPRYTTALHNLLASTDVEQQRAALEIIADDVDRRHIPVLSGYLYAVMSNTVASSADITAQIVTVLQDIGTQDALVAVEHWRQHHAPARQQQPVPPEQPDVQTSTALAVTQPSKTELVNYQEAFHVLLKHIRAGQWGDQQQASKTLHRLVRALPDENVPSVMAMFINAMGDSNALVRWASVEALAWLHHVEAVPCLGRAVSDANWSVRVAAIRALVEIGDVASVHWIEPALDDANISVQEAAVEAIGRLGGRRHAPQLAAIIQSQRDVMVRWAAAEAARRLRVTSAESALVAALNDPHIPLRWAAARALSEVADQSIMSDLIAHLHDDSRPDWEDKRVCDWLIEALQRIDTPSARTAVKQWRQTSI